MSLFSTERSHLNLGTVGTRAPLDPSSASEYEARIVTSSARWRHHCVTLTTIINSRMFLWSFLFKITISSLSIVLENDIDSAARWKYDFRTDQSERVKKGQIWLKKRKQQPVRCLSWGPAGMALIHRGGRVSSLFGPFHGGATTFRQTSYCLIPKWIILNDQHRYCQVVFKAHTFQALGKVENVWTQSLRAFLISRCVSSFYFCYAVNKVNCGCTGWITYLWTLFSVIYRSDKHWIRDIYVKMTKCEYYIEDFRANFCLLL